MTEPQKKNGRSTPPSNRSRSSYQHRRRKPMPILHRLAAKCKRLNWRTLMAVLLAVLLALLIVFFLTRCAIGSSKDPGTTGEPKATAEATTTPEPEPPQPTVYIFRDGEGYPVNMEGLTNAWAAEAGFEKRYTITDEERYELASVITAEAVGEPYAGKVAVAQCILQACEDDWIRPLEALERYTYSTRRPEPTDEALEAVAAVFDFGHVVTAEPIKYFYAPDLASSEWHESQVYVMTINNHKFFKEAQ